MKRLVEDPIIRHRLSREEFGRALDLVESLTRGGTGPLRIVSVDGLEVIVPDSIRDAWLDVASLLVCRDRATIMMVDEYQECSPTDASDILGISLGAVGVAVEAGKLTGRRLGRNRRVSMASIVAQQSARAATPATGRTKMVPLTAPLAPSALVDESRWDDGRTGGHLKKTTVAQA